MKVGVAKETFPQEQRVALTPAVLPALARANLTVLVEQGAGLAAGYPDADYAEKGAQMVTRPREVWAGADVMVQVRGLGANPEAGRGELDYTRPGQVIIGFQDPLWAPPGVAELAQRQAVVFALELLPRISRAQSMDALTSQANIAGYKAVLLAANEVHKVFPMMMTAAGTITPARVLIVGAGVAAPGGWAHSSRRMTCGRQYDKRWKAWGRNSWSCPSKRARPSRPGGMLPPRAKTSYGVSRN
jgi:H+-translocating NAD(P) transhydrogenase subunit alpha